jgi:Velvet factor
MVHACIPAELDVVLPAACYSPRKFPGQVPPTALSRKLANQGIKIPIRSTDKRPQAEAAGEKDEGDDDDDDL